MHWVYFLALSAFVYWVIFRNGAEVLAGWLAATVIDLFAGVLTVNHLKAYTGIIWLVGLIALAGRP